MRWFRPLLLALGEQYAAGRGYLPGQIRHAFYFFAGDNAGGRIARPHAAIVSARCVLERNSFCLPGREVNAR